ncbi:hypothetical protein B0T24DRAFT_672691 [Lasiosphaeria ovina]|uniref:Uncharacterized protein n=1 Tax=Lasiosphaeria ovina TaxID=92902 RepID=A0AAE0TX56_9PEZI|nr:hypothetical protein B0T24DRAFT_672691 [Lasiosphaeria ovina]
MSLPSSVHLFSSVPTILAEVQSISGQTLPDKTYRWNGVNEEVDNQRRVAEEPRRKRGLVRSKLRISGAKFDHEHSIRGSRAIKGEF